MLKLKWVHFILVSFIFQNAHATSSCLFFYKPGSKSKILDILGVTAAEERVRRGLPLPRAAHELYSVVDLQGETSKIRSSRHLRSVRDGGILVEPDMIFAPGLDRAKVLNEYLQDSVNRDDLYTRSKDIFKKNNQGPNDSTTINVRDAKGSIVKSYEVIEKINSALNKKLGLSAVVAEGMVPIKANAQMEQVLVSFTGRQKLSWKEIRTIEEQSPTELVFGRPESQRLGFAVIDLKTGQVVKAAFLPHEIDSITADPYLDRIYGLINGKLGEISLSSLWSLPSFSKNELSNPVALDDYRREFNQLVERDPSYLRKMFGVGYESSTIFTDYGGGTTPAVAIGRFEKGLILGTTPSKKIQDRGLSDILHFVMSPSSGMLSTFTMSLKDLAPELFKSSTIIKNMSVEDFKDNKLVLRADISGSAATGEHLIVIDYKTSQDRRGTVSDFEVEKVNFNWVVPQEKNSGKIMVSSDGSLFEIGKNKKGTYIRSLQPGREKKQFMLPEVDRILSVEVSSLGNVQVYVFQGGEFKTVIFDLNQMIN